ncbi:MAG: hypothetical protein WBA89_02360 [Microcoleus sp.]|uniref:hypothetical protein n=1 Tax=Microcoleus sp. TaxID=44472 RepID=UPI003C724BF1
MARSLSFAIEVDTDYSNVLHQLQQNQAQAIAQIIPNAIALAWEVGSLQALKELESAIARSNYQS